MQSDSIIDLRSDSLTRAPLGMLEAMSKVGLRNDEAINSFEDQDATKFQTQLAKVFDKEAAIIYPTRIMANNSVVFLQAKQGSEVIIAANSHALEHQHGAIAKFVGVQTRTITTKTGIFSVEQVKERIRKMSQHFTFPDTDLIFIQNPTSEGMVWPLEQLRSIKRLAEQMGVKVHIDGTRIFNALAHYNLNPKDISDCYDTMYICFEKGLCCPVGGAILGSKLEVDQLFLLRKGLGGGFFNMGIVAESERYALEHLLPLVKEDNQIALKLATQLSLIQGVKCSPQHTHINTVHWSIITPNFDSTAFEKYMNENKIKVKPFDEDRQQYRFAIYNQVRQKEIVRIVQAIKNYLK